MKTNRLKAFGALFSLSLGLLTVLNLASASAAADTCTWTGGGADDNFSTAANWSGCDNGNVPESGDALAFPAAETGAQNLVNDVMTVINGITVAAGTAGNGSYHIGSSGMDFQLTGDIEIGANEDFVLNRTMTLNGDLGIVLGNSASQFQVNTGGSIVIPGNSFLFIENEFYSTVSPGLDPANLPLFHVFDSGSIVGNDTTGIYAAGVELQWDFDATGDFLGVISLDQSVLTIADDAVFPAEVIILATDGQIKNTVSNGTNYTLNALVDIDGNLFGASDFTDTDYSTVLNSTSAATTLTFAGGLGMSSSATFSEAGSGGDIIITGEFLGDGVIVPGGAVGASTIDLDSSANTGLQPNGTYVSIDVSSPVTDSQPAVDVVVRPGETLTLNGARNNVAVASGGTLKGAGTVALLSVADGGHVAPGTSPGCLNSGSVSFVVGSSFDVEIAGNTVCTEYDQLRVTGTVDLGDATLNTTLLNGFQPGAGSSYTLIENDGSDAVTGTFAGLAQGATVTVGGVNFTISYTGGSGNDVVLSTAAAAPGAPNTGAGFLTANPLLTLAVTTASSLGLITLARRLKSVEA